MHINDLFGIGRSNERYKLLFTENTPFDTSDWEHKNIKQVFAGLNCIMAVTESGETLQKIIDKDVMARTEYWTRIKQISISKWAEGAAIGLVEDGTCLIAKRAVRKMCENFRLNFNVINDTVKSWKDVVQVASSDAFFALHSDGTVEYVSFCRAYQQEYREVEAWRDVKRIVTGTQNSVLGITADGRVLAAGYNLDRKKDKLSQCKNVVDLYPLGSECEDIYVLRNDGCVDSIGYNRGYRVLSSVKSIGDKYLDGHMNYKVYALTEQQAVLDASSDSLTPVFDNKYRIVSFAVGDYDYLDPFVVAVAEV